MSVMKIARNAAIIVTSTATSAVIGRAWNEGSQNWLDGNVAIKQKGIFGGVKYTTTGGKRLSKKVASELQYQLTSDELIRTRVGVGAAIGSISTLGAVGLSVGGIKAADALGNCVHNGMVTIAEKKAAKKAAAEQAVEQVAQVEVISEEEVTEE